MKNKKNQPSTTNTSGSLKIVVAVPTIAKLPPQFCSNFTALIASGLVARYVIVEGSLLPRVRNTMIQAFYKNDPDFTHVLMIDADMVGFDGNSLKKLLDADKDIISAVFTMRKPPYEVTALPFDKDIFQTALLEGDVTEVQYSGMAFTLVKRAVFDALAEETPDGKMWFNTDREPHEGFLKKLSQFIQKNQGKEATSELLSEAVLMGQMAHIGAPYIGEDINFCKWARRCGFGVWVHCGVVVGHLGEKIVSLRDAVRPSKQENSNEKNLPFNPDPKLVTELT